MNKLLGIEIPKQKAIEIFENLGLIPKHSGDDTVTCTVPSWRNDLTREVDLIEEAARSFGYDKIPTEHKINIEVAAVDKREKLSSQMRTILNGYGFYETINVTFVDENIAGLFTDPERSLSVKDETRKSANLLRQNLIGSLLGVFKTNYNAGNIPCKIFEIAATFKPPQKKADQLPCERTDIALLFDGDFRTLRSIVESIIKTASRDGDIRFEPSHLKWAKAAAQINLNGKPIGTAAIISKEVTEKFDLKDITICAAQIDFQSILETQTGIGQVKPIPRFPAITRDLSLIVEESIIWSDITNAISKKAPLELEDICFTAIYRGKPIDPGKKSVTVSMRFRDEDGTLRHETVDDFESNILQELKAKLNAELRTA